MSTPLDDLGVYFPQNAQAKDARGAMEEGFTSIVELHHFIIRSPLLREYGLNEPGELEQMVRHTGFKTERAYRSLIGVIFEQQKALLPKAEAQPQQPPQP
eukprot:EG_transcript_67514